MKLAVNWSPQAEALLVAGKIDVDMWKCSDWPELVEPAMKTKPAYVHFPLRAGDGSVPDWKAVRMWLEKTGTKYINMHLSVTQRQFPDIPFESRDPAHRTRAVDAMVRDIEGAGAEFGMDRIIVENLPTRYEHDLSTQPLLCSVDPQAIREAVERTGCGLLFDIDHARSAARELGTNLVDYTAKLPTDRIRELHMTGTIWKNDGLVQSHLPMQHEDWNIFDWAIDNIRGGAWSHPDIYAFEYGGIGPLFKENSDPAVLATQVPMFLKKVRSLNK